MSQAEDNDKVLQQFLDFFGPDIRIVSMHYEGGPQTVCRSIDEIRNANAAQQNIYYSANPATGSGRLGLKSLRFCTIDVDPQPGLDLNAQADLMHSHGLTVYNSGRGRVGLLRLASEQPLSTYERVQEVNRHLNQIYRGDTQVNSPAHLLKLPGTYAWMSAKKVGYAHAWTGDLRIGRAAVSLESLEKQLNITPPIELNITPKLGFEAEQLKQVLGALLNITAHTDMSAIWMRMLFIAAEFTTDEKIVRDVLFSSPFVTHGEPPSSGYPTREAKCEQRWDQEWRRALEQTEGVRRQRAHGRKVWEQVTHINHMPMKPDPEDYDDDTQVQQSAMEPFKLPRPPGLLGEITDYFEASAQIPIREVALAGAITYLSGLVGRCYRTETDASLGLYTVLIMPSGMGKNAAKRGPTRIEKAILRTGKFQQTALENYHGQDDFGSAQGMWQMLKAWPSRYCVVEDASDMVAAMGSKGSQANRKAILPALLTAYATDSDSRVGTKWLSKKEDSNDGVIGPNMSMLFDIQPEAFSESLDPTLIAKGLVSRLLCIRYYGKKPFNRETPPPAVPGSIVNQMLHLYQKLAMAMAQYPQHGSIKVPMSVEARELYTTFNRAYTTIGNNYDNEGPTAVYQRAALKILQLATLCAVLRNPDDPVVIPQDLQFAHTLVDYDARETHRLLTSGSIGQGASVREARIVEVMHKYRDMTEKQRRDEKSPRTLIPYGTLVPSRFLVRRLKNSSAFEDRNKSPTQVIQETLRFMSMPGGGLRKLEAVDVMEKLPINVRTRTRGLEQDFYQMIEWNPLFAD